MKPVGRRAVVSCLAGAALPAAPMLAATPASPLRVGLVPYLSTRSMLSVWEPLREHLQSALARPVEFLTSASFDAALDNARRADQHVSLMPAHFVRLALTDWGFTLIARPQAELKVQLWAPVTTAIEPGPGPGLAGRRVAVIDALALTSLMFERWLSSRGEGGEVREMRYPSSSSALVALRRGDVELVVATEGQVIDALGAEGLAAVRPVGRIGSLIPQSFLASTGLPEAEVAPLRSALLGYRPPRTGGVSAGPWVAGSVRDFDVYEAYAEAVRRHLAARAGRR